ncbi:hypothetical protein EYC84_006414 [Monilinia fructicola]|uniref:Uncharacterized protein n=1 Tax=Monilinia fructicola TaxID=38448 RepID=A0A5M9K5S6_MONFR|nr:hypothetical protein EYC84_006414 [Monilinia fructicola]
MGWMGERIVLGTRFEVGAVTTRVVRGDGLNEVVVIFGVYGHLFISSSWGYQSKARQNSKKELMYNQRIKILKKKKEICKQRY